MSKKSFWISLLLMTATLAVVQKMHIGTDVVVWKKNLDKLPYTIGGMQGVDVPLEESVVRELNTDVYIYRNYMSKDGRVINVYIGYYGTQKGGRSNHSPEGCYPGAGWSILREGEADIAIDNGGVKDDILLNTLQVKKGDENQLVYHWYQSQKNMVIKDGIQQNMNRLKSRLLYNCDDGAFIRVSEDIVNNIGNTKEDLENFIRHLFPLLVVYWPQEKELE
ncbi:MAG: exosortase C-terminal domain/associated protein EpsI [Desulfomonilia bacterium]